MKRATSLFLALFAVILNTALFCPVVKAEAETKISDSLPVVHINTDSGKNPGRDDCVDYFPGSMYIELNDYYKDSTNACTENDGVGMGIRTRGNSTRTFAGATSTGKYSYRIKLDEKVDLFGMGASKHWILLSNIYDPTYMRNMTAYELARALGLSYCDSTWVILYLNGEYRGLYQLCESIRVSKDRVDITDWDQIIENIADSITRAENLSEEENKELKNELESDMSWVTSGKFKNYKISDYYSGKLDITSGYIVEYDSFDNKKDTRPYLFDSGTTPAGVMLKVDAPEFYYTNSDMLSYVRQLVTDFEEAVTSPTFYNSKGKHYSEYCDMEDLVNFWLLQTVVKNGEFGIRSMFFYIEDGKIHWGPVWDFDCGAGNHLTVDTEASGWNGGGHRNEWYHALYGDPYFTALVQERYAAVRDTIDSAVNAIEIYHDYIAKEAQNDLDFYGPHGFNTMYGNVTGTFEEEYEFYLSWQKERIKWLDSNLLISYPNIGDEGPYRSEKISLGLKYAGGAKLSNDSLTVYGCKGTYLYYAEKSNDISFSISTTHTTCRKIAVYINGLLYKEMELTDKKGEEGVIERDALCLEDGYLNSVYIVVINSDGYAYNGTSFTVRAFGTDIPANDQCITFFGNNKIISKKYSNITLPDTERIVPGMTFAGWSDGKKVYAPGSTFNTDKNRALYEKWVHDDGFAVLNAAYTPIALGSKVINPPPIIDVIVREDTDKVTDHPAEPADELKNDGSSGVYIILLCVSLAALAAAVATLIFVVKKR